MQSRNICKDDADMSETRPPACFFGSFSFPPIIQNRNPEHKVSELVHAVVGHAFCGATGRRDAEGLPQSGGNVPMPGMRIVKQSTPAVGEYMQLLDSMTCYSF